MAETRDAVLEEVGPLAERFVASGFHLYLVGGIVRDLQLGAALDDLDLDLTTDARPADIKRLVGPIASAVWTQGERFGTIGCRIDGRPIEITTHRAEWYDAESRKPGVAFGDDVEVDLSRRDFTVNAMAIEVPSGRLVDPFEGRAALEARSLETPIDPEVSFSDDPLRILRAARFIARYSLVPAEGVFAAARSLIDRLSIVSVERIREEYDKLLAASSPSAGLRFLDDVGAVRYMFSEMPDDVFDELGSILDRSPIELLVRRLVTFSHVPPAGREAQLSSLRYSNQERRQILAVLHGLDIVADQLPTTDEKVRRLVLTVGHDDMATLFTLADLRGVTGTQAVRAAFIDLAAREDLTDLSPAITGGDIIRALGVAPGPAVGEAMSALGERRLTDGPASASEELDWLRERGVV